MFVKDHKLLIYVCNMLIPRKWCLFETADVSTDFGTKLQAICQGYCLFLHLWV